MGADTVNCKQGDLAFVVGGAWDGFIVRCVRPYNGPWATVDSLPGWWVDRKLQNSLGYTQEQVADYRLRPIRPGEGEDETLTWAPRKEGVPA